VRRTMSVQSKTTDFNTDQPCVDGATIGNPSEINIQTILLRCTMNGGSASAPRHGVTA
jgi:hypothetical protein